MKSIALTSLATALLSSACGGAAFSHPDPEGDRGRAAGSSPSGETAASTGTSGMPCSYLHGEVTLTSWRGEQDRYASSAFSFEYASQDAELTHNEFDVLYEGNMFMVNMIVDDASFIVDLGDAPLREVPASVDPDAFARGQWGKHDAIQAQINHTYFVRSVDRAGTLVSAFRVIYLEPGSRATIEWIRSTDADVMAHPLGCLR